jgi:hypothetical protein
MSTVKLFNMYPMLGLIVSTIAYFFGLWLGSYLLAKNEIELPRFSRWIILNVFALVISSLAAMPFPSLLDQI